MGKGEGLRIGKRESVKSGEKEVMDGGKVGRVKEQGWGKAWGP